MRSGPRPRDDPEEIIRRIADFRSSEKSDPHILRAANRQQSAAAPCDEKATPTQRLMALTDQSSAFNSIRLSEHP